MPARESQSRKVLKVYGVEQFPQWPEPWPSTVHCSRHMKKSKREFLQWQAAQVFRGILLASVLVDLQLSPPYHSIMPRPSYRSKFLMLKVNWNIRIFSIACRERLHLMVPRVCGLVSQPMLSRLFLKTWWSSLQLITWENISDTLERNENKQTSNRWKSFE